MLKRFRRPYNAIVPANGISPPAIIPIENSREPTEEEIPPFFRIPIEVRNQIYELVAGTTVLTLKPAPKHRGAPPKAAKHIPGLLVASRRNRNEALPILLSIARLEVNIIDFNFKNLERVTSGLYSTELRALRENKKLVIRLSFTQSRSIAVSIDQDLRRWLVKRADGLDRLPWRYVVDTVSGTEDRPWVRDAKSRLHWLGILHDKLEDTLQFELLAIMDVLESEMISRNGEIRRS